MAIQQTPVPAERVSCKVCLKEVPKSEAVVAEANDYVAHFCGLECFEKWKAKDDNAKRPGGKRP